jgi:hypothetical protein
VREEVSAQKLAIFFEVFQKLNRIVEKNKIYDSQLEVN